MGSTALPQERVRADLPNTIQRSSRQSIVARIMDGKTPGNLPQFWLLTLLWYPIHLLVSQREADI
jgi:hypothetical protein